MIELTREIARRFNNIYNEVFIEPEPKVSNTGRIKGLDGNFKMSKSLGNAIYLKDTKEELKNKIFSAYTDPQKIRKMIQDILMVVWYIIIINFFQKIQSKFTMNA